MRGIFLFLVLLLSSSGAKRHPFYVSMTEMEWKPAEKKLEVAVRMFTDDLEKALSAQCHCRIDLSSGKLSAGASDVLEEYLKSNLRFHLGKAEGKMQFLGSEKEEESTWSYLEITGLDASSGIETENRLLFSVQEKQVNLLRFRRPGFDKTIQLKYPESKAAF